MVLNNLMKTRQHAYQVMQDRVAKLETKGSADQIRDFFVEQQIGGSVGNRNFCPVANYLRTEVEAETGYPAVAISVDPKDIELGGMGEILGVSTPETIAAFIAIFDDENYEELIRSRLSYRGGETIEMIE